ncbi:MAG: hypothetical protein U1F58_08335 [Burkholderiales bacterium]
MADVQLVLQFRGSAVEDVDEVTEIEDALFEMLEHGESLDGHDVRAGARNIYILTAAPEATFRRLEPFFARARLLDALTVAFRPPAADTFTILWPADHRKPFALA